MKYDDKIQVAAIFIAPPDRRRRATASGRATPLGWSLHTTALERKLS